MIDYNGELLEEGLSLEDAVHLLLTGDGGSYEIRKEESEFSAGEELFRLWLKKSSAVRWTPTLALSVQTDREAAEQEIYKETIKWSFEYIEALPTTGFAKQRDKREALEAVEAAE